MVSTAVTTWPQWVPPAPSPWPLRPLRLGPARGNKWIAWERGGGGTGSLLFRVPLLGFLLDKLVPAYERLVIRRKGVRGQVIELGQKEFVIPVYLGISANEDPSFRVAASRHLRQEAGFF